MLVTCYACFQLGAILGIAANRIQACEANSYFAAY
jgi:hypothetical protein